MPDIFVLNNSYQGAEGVDDDSNGIKNDSDLKSTEEAIKFEETDEKNSSKHDMLLLKEDGQATYVVSYPPAKYRFNREMLDKPLCDQYTMECIDVRFLLILSICTVIWHIEVENT
ncbi:unnamed protein product [Gongylonema pulchrum]|uniref:DDE_Tnp_1_7 domain-containing protein n=1 Tax=Gongylonema pulchrum TaxID=637853 RepID=A0A183CUX0_9BILA|nr:unnamed protein product [Gongylonema pulchrum]